MHVEVPILESEDTSGKFPRNRIGHWKAVLTIGSHGGSKQISI